MIEMALLGTLQGLTEFLPVSSSAHLIFISKLVSWPLSLQEMVLLHVGTLFALFWYFRRDILSEFIRFIKGDYGFGLKIILAVFTTVLLALPLESAVDALSSQAKVVSGILFGMGLILISMKFLRKENGFSMRDLTYRHAVVLGLLQGIAVIPGISRSGITIVGLLLMGFEPSSAFLLSFFVGIPAILGASILELPKIQGSSIGFTAIFSGLLFSIMFGILALIVLRRIVIAKKMHWFGVYCCVVAIIVNLYIG